MADLTTPLAQAHAARSFGSGQKTIVFGHGLGGNQHHWDEIWPAFADRYRVITFDQAGSGKSDPSLFSSERHSSLFGFADDLNALLHELDIQEAIYVGHSLAGMSGAITAAAEPEFFDKVILIGASARYIDDPDTGYLGGFTEEAVTGLLDAMSADYNLWAAGFAPVAMANPDRPELATEFARGLAAYRPDVALTSFRAAFTGDYRMVPPRVMAPTLILQTQEDVAVPMAAAQWLTRTIPQAEMRIINGQGHFPHLANPDQVIAEIEAFLSESG